MKKRQLIIIGVTLVVLAGSIGLNQFFASQKEPPKERPVVEVKNYVKTRPVEYKDIETNVFAYGRVQSAQSLDLLSEVSGRMYEGNVRLKEGVSFKKGTLLFYIDDTEAKLNLSSQKSNFLRDLAAILPDLKIDYSDNYDKWREYFSKIDIEDNLPKLPEVKSEKEKTFIATQGLFSSYYTIKSAEERLSKYRYYAPWDGSITMVNFQTGAFINPGTSIGQIMRSGIYELKVAVETRDIPWIQQGSPAQIFSEETQQGWEGVVTRISDYVNQNTQSVDVFVAIDTRNQKIYDGQFLKTSIPARTVKDGMIMPRAAIYNGNEVFVLEDSFLTKKSIDVYRLNDETAVFGGIEEGSDLVIEPLIGAYNNMKAFKAEDRNIDMETKTEGETKLANSNSASGQGS